MPEAVYRLLRLVCRLVAPLPIGTNLGLLHLLWMLVSGQLLARAIAAAVARVWPAQAARRNSRPPAWRFSPRAPVGRGTWGRRGAADGHTATAAGWSPPLPSTTLLSSHWGTEH